MLSFLNKYAGNIKYSQNGEESILIEVFNRLGIEKGVSSEFGGHDGAFCSNTAYLLEQGWSGTFVETDFGLWQQCRDRWAQRKDVKCVCSRVSPENIHAFVKYDCDLLSMDTDGSDFDLFEALKVKPKVVVLEIDSSIEPPSTERNPDGAYGYYPTVGLGIEKGYCLLAHTGNLILVDQEYWNLFPEVHRTHPLLDYELYFKRDWVKKEAA